MPSRKPHLFAFLFVAVAAAVGISLWICGARGVWDTLDERLAREGGIETLLAQDLSGVPESERDAVHERALYLLRRNMERLHLGRGLASVEPVGRDRIRVRIAASGVRRVLLEQHPTMNWQDFVLQPGSRSEPLEFRWVADASDYTRFLADVETLSAVSASAAQGATRLAEHLQTIPVSEASPLGGVDLLVAQADESAVSALLQVPEVLERLPAGTELLWAHDQLLDPSGAPARLLYLVRREALLRGSCIDDVSVRRGDDASNPLASGVLLTLTSQGATQLGMLTTESVGRRLALVWGDEVFSAPVVTQPISNGLVSLTGNFTDDEAEQLAAVMRGGSRPAPEVVVESHVIPPERD